MKKFILPTFKCFTISLFLFQTSYAQYDNVRLDQEDVYQKDPASPNSAPELVYISKNVFYYDNGGTKNTRTESFSRPIGTTEWMESSQIINIYNASNNLITSETQNYDGSQYQPFLLSEYTYDTNGNNDTIYNSFYNAMNWEKNSRNVYSYNPDNTISETRSDTWNAMSLEYDYQSLVNYTYDSGLIKSINAFNYNGMTLEDNYRAALTHTSFDEIETIFYEKYNGTDWEDWLQVIYNYFGELLLNIVQQRWDDTLITPIWVNSIRTQFSSYQTINNHDIATTITGQGYDETLVISNPDEGWFDSYRLEWQLSSTLSSTTHTEEESFAYPNPFNDHITISLSQALNTDGSLFIYDSIGKEMSKTLLKPGTKSISLNSPNLAKGIYFVKISNENFNQTFKIVKE